MKNEPVLCIKRSDTPKSWLMNEVAISMELNTFLEDIDGAKMQWIPRYKAEQTTDPKQLIPYAVIVDGKGQFACYPRHGSEKRIHGLWSIGIGGHIDYVDECPNGTWEKTIKTSLTRELSEELNSNVRLNPIFKGVINEEKTKVGANHLGLVFLITISDHSLISPAEEIEGLIWLNSEQLGSKDYPLELWSKLAMKLIKK